LHDICELSPLVGLRDYTGNSLANFAQIIALIIFVAFKSYSQRPRADFVLAFVKPFKRTLKSQIKTYFLQKNIRFFKLRHPKEGIYIFSDFFVI
jgi:hypothetical protein